MPAPARIGLVKLSSLGDVIHALPLARALRRARPGSHLAWIVERREAAILRGHPDLDAVIEVDLRSRARAARQPGGALALVTEIARVRREVRRLRLDAVIDAQGLAKSGLIARATRAPVRIAFARGEAREWPSAVLATTRVTPPASAVHVVDKYLALLRPLGVTPGPAEFHIPLRPPAAERMEAFLAEHGVKPGARLVVLNPGAGRPEKRWPAERFRALAERLHTETVAAIVVLWGPGELELGREIAGAPCRPLLAPPTDIDDLAALLRRAALVVAGDTGPLHLAAAVETSCLGLFGPTRAERNGPYGPRGRAVESPDGTMAGLAVDRVAAAARPLLDAS
ncbi:MAG: glycosyltransferase family 9 protein [Candidatus Rokubacteria bacterium]|nr:glycosyltransferase family 9 protein [Candidatus Rokubacteria bacterium]